MKRYLTLLAALAALTLALSFLAGCSGERKPSISAGIDACALCNMVIDRPNQACGYFMGSEFVTFDAPSCLLKSYDALRKDDAELPDEIYFTDYKNVTFHRAETTFFPDGSYSNGYGCTGHLLWGGRNSRQLQGT